MGERGGAADIEPLEAALGEVDAGGRTQHHPRVAPAEGDQGHLVAADVRMPEEREDGSFGGQHSLLRIHRCRGVHHEDDQIAGLALADLLAQILALELQLIRGVGCGLPPAQLMRGRRPDGGIKGDVGDLLRLRTAHVATAFGLAFRGGTLACRAPGLALAWQVELLDREGAQLDHGVRLNLDRLGAG